jgi:hypothetical protein
MSIALFKTNSIATKREERKWNNQEIADFYRAVDILKRAGLDVEVDSGVTDEGEPWLVFVRSGDGEVLAHFAQIDRQFVAVSSLNHEVYKGSDIRQIVDRMLEKHPLVVPKTANSGKLYLHPTAAVTAFLAAAFLLNVDGIKLSSVEEILVSVSTKGPSALASAAISVQSTGKGDIAKWGQLDAASTNYNVVVLGAALIAHELGFSETVDVNSSEIEMASFDVNGDFIKGKAENDTSVLTKGLPDAVSASAYISEQEAAHFVINLENKGDELKVISSKNQPKENQELKLDLSHKHFSNEGIVELSSSFMSSWESSNSELKQHYRDTNKSRDANKITPYEVNENFVRVEQVYPEEGDGIGMSSVPPTELSKTLIFNFDLAALVGSEDSQIASDNIDDMSLIALQEINLTSDMVFLDKSLQNVYDGNNTLGLSSLGEELAAPMIIEESSDIGLTSIPMVDSVMQLPIIGHSTIDSKDGVDMTAGIDVVFYQGGDVEIKGFELGVDLLWFFLSEDELRTSQNTVNSEGDVVLNFGEMGSLVFLGLVPSSPDDILI